MSSKPQAFSESGFAIPDGGVVVTLSHGQGWKAGTVIRFEVFVQGNLVRAAPYSVP